MRNEIRYVTRKVAGLGKDEGWQAQLVCLVWATDPPGPYH